MNHNFNTNTEIKEPVMSNTAEETKKATEPAKKIKNYYDINKAKQIIKDKLENNSELIMLLNELTLARNLEEKNIKKSDYTFVSQVDTKRLQETNEIVMLSGVYNKKELNTMEAETQLLKNGLEDKELLIVARDSIFLKTLV